MAMILLSFGHGYSAQALARLLPSDWEVIGTTRQAEKADALRTDGLTARLFPGDDLRDDLARATHILISAGPGPEGDPVLAALRDEISAVAGDKAWIGYLSTTGVYGDHQGGWVDEATPLTPSTERGKARVAAEAAWQNLAAETGAPLHIFRLAGIYGPGRGPFAKVRRGTARRIIKPGQVFSRIHVDDIAQVLWASMTRPNPGAIYNLCDDEAAPPEDVIAYAAELLGLPTPPAIPIDQAEMSPMARSFYAESKRVSNKRIKEDLGVTLRYPNYRVGLQALLAAEATD
ncbi:NAD-dependent epimerase/dehydratase family protein [Roseobacter sp. HKCCD9010]|uniref:SDR family oxidoreductase n=1 Tax=unclassified Roseobacter TaxID=196798 RepID=UPI001492BBBA|nr:NAD-dependent epimerase/dehydratase family protein [Rhodobacterales bacterium HKCCD4356]NNV12961.1 NAD-dependent epimerase/dehydratase family protein [Roseobacter sp. HKCCD7357]NNV16906.1 NAD-dependent epimerase/dehydratase family protein [Roseobacter sp. HKCCD8768]NNV26462.1 NAD-dependent epimerase/dehydratase family protein [Roseobacter sp. HKCCD8192]NNV30627.1 NAD-dependent epimerase/dehydratase family protein [Roseobacter sp. HKCCD9061]NNV34538.1 NAD-dependent epimerase/dehydratase fami